MRLRCTSIQRYLSDYIDFTLSGRKTVLVARHLRSCRSCQDELESLKQTKMLVSNFYVEPEAPDTYHDHFWEQLQQTIESRPRPIWWRAGVLCQTSAWKGEASLNRFTRFFGALIDVPTQWALNWLNLSPYYTFIVLSTLAILFISHFHQLPDDRDFLRAYPTHLVAVQENRKLMNTPKRIISISQPLPNQSSQQTQRVDQLDENKVSEGGWNQGYIASNTVSHDDVLRTVALSHETTSDFIAFAQLESPKPLLTREEFSFPLGINYDEPFATFERKSRRANRFVEMLMNVPIRILSITEVYDSVKL